MRKAYLFLIAVIVFGSASLLFASSKSDEVYVENKVRSVADEDGFVKVIIKLKDTPELNGMALANKSLETQHAAINKSQRRLLSTVDNEQEFNLRRKFKFSNSVSATVSKEMLKRLEKNQYVEGIFYDIPLQVTLNDSVALINSSDFWNININNLSINGTGESICVIDTGIDYTHPALGGCTITNFTQYGNNDSFANESGHNYLNDSLEIFKINFTGFTKIGVHFINISTESGYDYIKILDPNNDNDTIAVYTGNHSNIWTPSVDGDTLYVLLQSDNTTSGWGFKIDQVINGTVNTSVNWSSCEKVTGGWDFIGSDNSLSNGSAFDEDPRDNHNNGHGTHVAGIVASMNETYRGVAPGARIVAVKTMNSTGSGVASDLIAGIEFCAENKERLNISAIVMSLGDSTQESSPCDSRGYDEVLTSRAVDIAIRNGIFVAAASGNNGYTSGISYPSCLENVTSVGYSNKADSIVSGSNRGPNLDLFAPGENIMSTQINGGFVTLSGTSMAAPHAAGAAILLINFKRLENGSVPTPQQITNILKLTGKNISGDANRINLTKALAYIDDTPRIAFISGNNTGNISRNYSFVNITATEPIVNATIYVDGTGFLMNGSNRNFYYNITNLASGTHNFSVNLTDTTNKKASSGLQVFDVDTIKPNITGVANISINTSVYMILFNATESVNATIYYGTSEGSLTSSVTNNTYLSNHNLTIPGLNPATTYFYYINVSDMAGNRNFTSNYNFTTQSDTTFPAWSSPQAYPSNNSNYTSSQKYQFNVTWTEAFIDRVLIEHNFTGSFANYSVTGNASNLVFYYNHTSGLAAAGYSWRMHANDTSGNLNSSEFLGFVVNKGIPSINLSLNRTESNKSISQGSYLYINATIQAGDYSTLELFVDGNLTNFGNLTLENYTLFNSTGTFNITVRYNATQNFSQYSEELFVIVASQNPIYTGLTQNPSNNSVYSSSQKYQFNVTWTSSNISRAWIEHNFNGSYYNYTMTGNSGSVFYYNYTTLAAGNYSWKMHANDTSGNLNSTDLNGYVIIQANSSINLTLNGTSNNITISPESIIRINATILSGEGSIDLFLDGTLINSGTVLGNLSQFNTSGRRNITAVYNETQNYSVSFKTFLVNVSEAYPIISVIRPLNNSFSIASTITLNFTTDESTTCNYTLTTGYNATLGQNQTAHNATLGLSDGNYNITLICKDSSNLTASGLIFNFTVDTTNPSLNIAYPQNSTYLTNLTLQVNYTLNETNLNRVWFLKNYNMTKNYLTPSETTGGNNYYNVTFEYAGKKTLSFFANDSAGNIISSNITFYINLTLNATQWSQQLNQSSSANSVVLFNSSNQQITENISLEQNISIELNFTNITVNIYNFTGINAVWDFLFSSNDSDPVFESQINTIVGTDPLDYLIIKNFTGFLNETNDYYGKVKLPRNISFYRNIYFCGNDDLTDCEIISPCTSQYYENDTEACYNTTAQNVFVYVPHFSSVFGDNDTVAPTVNITSPSNNSVLTTSSGNNLIFSANENSTCSYALNSGSFSSLSGTTYFTASFNVTSNGAYNLSVNCTDGTNSGVSKIGFNVSDITAPSFSAGPSDTSTTSTITITYTTSEAANTTVTLSNGASSTDTEYILSHSVQFTGLSDGTAYSYNITVCDRTLNCANTTGSETTDTESSGSSGSSDGSSSGSGTTSAVAGATSSAPTTKVSQVFLNPSGQIVMNIASTKIAFTRLILSLKNSVQGSVLMSVESKDILAQLDLPENEMFQFIEATKTLITDENLTSVVIRFRVDKSWATENNIDPDTVALYRYSGAWVKLETEKTSDDSTYYYYESESPGLSYFAITGKEIAGQETQAKTTDTADNQLTGEVIQEVSQEREAQDEIKKGSGIRIVFILIIPLILLAAIIGGTAGFIIYQRNISVLSDKELRDLKEYVERCKSEGIEFENIKSALTKVGWSEYIIDLVMHDVHLPTEEMDKLVNYILYLRNKGKDDEEIKNNLVKAGWQEGIIRDSFSTAKKQKKK